MGILGSPGMGEMLVVGVIALLLFGKRLPEVARNVGKSVNELKRAMSGFTSEIDSVNRDLRSPTSSTPPSRSMPGREPTDETEFDVAAPKFSPPAAPVDAESKA
ncbi:Sec-independent protein translocase subunit TatA/TatB [Stratiformator vulcanicus]|uniref:Sec-independent translocase n=1 Tax=Stratiformator vulcanicus TaxID=2527980 RepID=A0A517R2V0_9PLAN|nr:twin-arginine translocase TatA/TatE family subunit [Stratiformator vulcanicus]QDT38198.1 sec-independent translocase [Stratiformator vulcanicus]